MEKTFEIAVARIKQLPPKAQEMFGRYILKRVAEMRKRPAKKKK